jgi:hypothetical protein
VASLVVNVIHDYEDNDDDYGYGKGDYYGYGEMIILAHMAMGMMITMKKIVDE